MKHQDALALSQIDRRLNTLRLAFSNAKVRPGWIHYMRQALGMTLKKLGERAGVALPTVAQAERGEAKGKITLETLKKMAEAMECEFMYAFVPNKSVKEVLTHKAFAKAKQLLKNANTHMTLEDQHVEEDEKGRIERLARRLLEKGEVW